MTSNGDKGAESPGHDGNASGVSNGDIKRAEAVTNGANGVSEGAVEAEGDAAIKKNRREDYDDDEEDEGDDDEEGNEDDDEEEDNDVDGDEEEEDSTEATTSKGKGKGKEKIIEKRPRKRARRYDDDNLDRFEAISKDELSSLSGNDIIPRARRSAAIASQRRTASEIGRFVGRGHDDDDDSDEDGQLGGSFATPSAGVGDGESDDEAELEF